MTTTSDGAQPNPGDQQQQPDPAAVAAAAQGQQPQPQEPEPQPVDIDEQAVIDAKAEAEAEKSPAIGAGEGAVVEPGKVEGQQQQPAAQQDQQPQSGGQQQPVGETVMIPKARLDEALAKKDEAETTAAYWKGRADALATGQQPQPKPGEQQQPGGQQQQPSAQDRLTAIQAEQDALALKYDNGEISYSDLTTQQRALSNKEFAIREEMLVAKVQPAVKPAEQGSDQLYLETLTAEIEKQHPWVEVFDKIGTPRDWQYMRDTAADNLVARGIDPRTPMGRYELRKEAATLMDQYGPAMLSERAKAKGIAIPGQTPSPGGQQQQQQQPKTPLSPAALARAAKLDIAAGSPPSLTNMNGNQGDPGGLPSDTRLEGMSDEEIGALPDNVRTRLLGLK